MNSPNTPVLGVAATSTAIPTAVLGIQATPQGTPSGGTSPTPAIPTAVLGIQATPFPANILPRTGGGGLGYLAVLAGVLAGLGLASRFAGKERD